MKYAIAHPFADPEIAARRLLEHAQAFEPVHDGRIYIEKINGPFLFGDKATPAESAPGSTSRSSGAGWSCCTKAEPS
jgi:hypothetical protein